MGDIIQLLPDYVANQIAAGEVVQRPSSVVKEILENAVDAEATHIKLVIKDSGKVLIQIIDDGKGMSMTDGRMAFERHATSKIRASEDLFDIRTKGFRGEALASIAAVSQLTCLTKQSDDELGTKIVIEGGKLLSQDHTTTNKGTSIAVKNLFYNIPARRNFLKSDQVELTHIINEFHRIALSHPEIAFNLYHNKGELFHLSKGTLRDRIVNIFGSKIRERLVPIEEHTDLVNISGYIIKPEYAKKSRGTQFFFANHRFIKSPYLHHAMVSGFEGLLQQGYHPSYFVYFDIAPDTIDINIHPTKTEIKFENEQAVYAILRSAVKHSFGQYHISPTIDFSQHNDKEVPYHYKDKNPRLPSIEVNPGFNPFKENKSLQVPNTRPSKWEALYVDKESQTALFEKNQVQEAISSRINTPEGVVSSQEYPFVSLFNKYIITISNAQSLLIYRNRAHRRVLYDDFMRQLAQERSICQQLIFPLILNFSIEEIRYLSSLNDYLADIGFSIDYEKEKLNIKGIPASIKESEVLIILENLLSDIDIGILSQPKDYINKHIAKSLCKSLAVKSGKPLAYEAEKKLLQHLWSSSDSHICPFKKPIFVSLSETDINKFFSNDSY